MEDPTSLAAVLEDPNATAPQPAEGNLSDVVQPDIGKAILSPITDEKVIESRKLGWTTVFEKFRDNPNLQQAIGIAGARLMQPIKPGESSAGNLGQAVVAGQTAFRQGELLERQQRREDVADIQKAEMHAVQVPGVKAKTEQDLATAEERRSAAARNTALLPGDTAASRVATETADSKVKQAKALADKAVLEAEVATDTETINKVLRRFEKEKAAVLATIPDAKVKAIVEAELATPEAKLKLLKQQIATSAAAAGEHGAGAKLKKAQTEGLELENEAVESLTPEERVAMKSGTGKFAKATSGAGATLQHFGSLYEGLVKSAPDDPRVKGKTKEQFQMDAITSMKQQDASTALKNYMTAVAMANIDPDPEIVAGLANQMKSNIAAKAGTPAAAGANPRARKPIGSFDK